jgi:plastocyanin
MKIVPAPRYAVLRAIMAVGFVVALVLLLGFSPLPPAGGTPHRTIPVRIPGDYFSPFIVPARVGDTVTWTNLDTKPHTIVAAQAPRGVEPDPFPLALAPRATRSVTFTTAGVYDLYDPHAALYNAKLGRVVARTGEAPYPIPMEQVVVVMGPGFQPQPREAVTVTSPGDYFTPYITVVRQGGTVTFLNTDTDLHTVEAAPNSPDRFPAALTLTSGRRVSVRMTRPGVYDYYCTVHATYSSRYGRVAAHRGTDVYPVDMEGIIVVVPTR